MIYDLAHWLYNKAKELWNNIWEKGFFGKLLLFPINSILAILFLLISLILFTASFMTILENIARLVFFYFKKKTTNSGFFGKIIYFPLLLIATSFCVGIILLSIGQAMPFKQS